VVRTDVRKGKLAITRAMIEEKRSFGIFGNSIQTEIHCNREAGVVYGGMGKKVGYERWWLEG